MTGKRMLLALSLALAIGVSMGTFTGVAIADEQGMGSYGTSDSPFFVDPVRPESDVVQSDTEKIREPMETGAVPDRPESSVDLICCSGGGDPTFNLGGP